MEPSITSEEIKVYFQQLETNQINSEKIKLDIYRLRQSISDYVRAQRGKTGIERLTQLANIISPMAYAARELVDHSKHGGFYVQKFERLEKASRTAIAKIDSTFVKHWRDRGRASYYETVDMSKAGKDFIEAAFELHFSMKDIIDYLP